MTILLQDQSGIGQGIQQASSALGQALQQRGLTQQQQQLMQQQQGQEQQIMSSLDQALANADFSSPEGRKDVLRTLIQNKVPIKESLAIMDKFAPDPVQSFLNRYSGQQPVIQPQVQDGGVLDQAIPQQGQPVFTEEQTDTQNLPIPGRPGEVADFQEREMSSFGQLPDSALIEAVASGDPRLKAMSQAEQERRTRSDKRYETDRKFHTEGARPWLKKIDESREAIRSKGAALNMMANAIEQGNLDFFSKDNFANFLGRFGEGLRSPEGALMMNATKEFLLSNIQRAGARPNQWIEQQISQMLTKIGRSDEANLSTVEALKSEVEVQELYRDQTDQIAEFYREKLGFVPENIGSLVDNAVEPLAQQIQDKLSYGLRNIKERHNDINELSKKKVVKGTPLTVEMATIFAREYGKDKALERAKKLGYTIPSKEQYMRYTK